MDFDKNKILTSVTADQAKVGQKGWFADTIDDMMDMVSDEPTTILSDIDVDSVYPFSKKGSSRWLLFYPAPEPTYAERQAEWIKANDINVGDKVRITRKARDCESGWGNVWTPSMDRFIGEICEVTSIGAKPYGLTIKEDDESFCFPYFVLEKVVDNDEKYTISEVVCITCGRRWIATRPESVKLKDMECKCGRGNVIETGELIATTVNKGE